MLFSGEGKGEGEGEGEGEFDKPRRGAGASGSIEPDVYPARRACDAPELRHLGGARARRLVALAARAGGDEHGGTAAFRHLAHAAAHGQAAQAARDVKYSNAYYE